MAGWLPDDKDSSSASSCSLYQREQITYEGNANLFMCSDTCSSWALMILCCWYVQYVSSLVISKRSSFSSFPTPSPSPPHILHTDEILGQKRWQWKMIPIRCHRPKKLLCKWRRCKEFAENMQTITSRRTTAPRLLFLVYINISMFDVGKKSRYETWDWIMRRVSMPRGGWYSYIWDAAINERDLEESPLLTTRCPFSGFFLCMA